MFWADKVAGEIINSGKYKPYWVDDMKTPSGRVHVGALRGVVVHDLAYKALKDRGVKAKFTYVFEDHDPMDDIPSYLPREKFEKYLGMPLFKIPSPEQGHENYARFYASEFEKVFRAIGCTPEIIWTKDLYTKGLMNPLIKEVLDKTEEVEKIYEGLYKKTLPKDWYPFQVYCESCGKVSTTQVTGWDGRVVTYECVLDKVKFTKGCGTKGRISPYSDEKGIVGKLPWKVEWPCKWKAIGVTVEGAGKDHMSAGGSHDLAKLICERVIDYPVPYPIAYEWLLIGGRKMSSSRGVGTAAIDMLDILPPELIRFLMVRIKVNTQINFDPSDSQTIPNLFDDYQKAYLEWKKDSKSDDGRIFELSQIGEEVKVPPMDARFWNLVQWVQMPNMDEEIKKAGFEEWAKYAKVYVERFAPEDIKYEVKKELPERAKQLSKEQKKYLSFVGKQLGKDWDAEEFQKKLYEWAKEV
ncbi:MAG: lysine--tRNA ligase, partial [Patescibacteria group bacterium]